MARVISLIGTFLIGELLFHVPAAVAQDFDWRSVPEGVKKVREVLEETEKITEIAERLGQKLEKGTRKLVENITGGPKRGSIRPVLDFEAKNGSDAFVSTTMACRKVVISKKGDDKKSGRVQILVLDPYRKDSDGHPAIKHKATLRHGDEFEWKDNLGDVVVVVYGVEVPARVYLHVEWNK